jgi:hypothetical protein
VASSGKGRTGGRTASAKRAIAAASSRSVFASRPVARAKARTLARVDDRDRQAGRGQGRREADLQAARGLEHRRAPARRDQTLDQRRHALVIVAEGGALAGGA